jgi:PTS system nitrogen regulatory IIA component
VTDEFEADPPLPLADHLTIGRIVLGVEGSSIGEAVRRGLGTIPAGELPLPSAEILSAVLERERLAPTYLGRGIAMPHARLSGLDRPSLVLMRSDAGIPVEGQKERARLLFLLLTPAGQPRVHQKLQARIAEFVAESDFVRERLLDASAPAEVYEVVRTGEQASID